MNEILINAGIAFVSIGILMAYVEWRNREYSNAIKIKIDAVMQKLIDIKNR